MTRQTGYWSAHTLNPILTIFGTWGGPQDVFLSFEFQVDRSQNFGATGGQNSTIPINKTDRLYNISLLPHKLWLVSQCNVSVVAFSSINVMVIFIDNLLHLVLNVVSNTTAQCN